MAPKTPKRRRAVSIDARPELLEEELTGTIRQTAYDVHRYFGNGFLEKVYENALAHRLHEKGLDVRQQFPVKVHDEDGTIVGDYSPDLLVEDRIIVETKAVRSLTDEDTAQVLNYLKATRLRVGLLINFGAKRLRCRRFVL
jgi:GxxExxY protein